MKSLYAEVVVDISHEELDRSFSYRVPETMRESICVGSSVRVPFGKNGRLLTGWVTELKGSCDYPEESLKAISEVVTGENVVESHLVRLAAWIRESYGSTMSQALHTVLPWRKKVSSKVEKYAALTLGESEAGKILEAFEEKHQKARARVMRLLLPHGEMPCRELIEKAGVSLAVLKQMEEKGWIRLTSASVFRSVIPDNRQEESKPLSEAQVKAVGEILEEWQDSSRPVLLHGITGSGKTEVYMALIERILSEDRQAIVLIPEIALTYQTVERFVRRFGDVVSFLHSRLSEGEKYDQFRAARSGRIRIMVGPRSALFTPFPRLGLIIVDEEHEKSYASESMPRYHARETAIERGNIEGAHVLMGSASPSLEAFWRCENGKYRLVSLTQRFGGSHLPESLVIDMRQELAGGNRSVLSARLKTEITKRLDCHEQVMLFLNRRGTAGYVTCRRCGHVEICPHCDVALTQHRNGKLICHYCGFEKPVMKTCPSCGSSLFGGIRIGTEAVEEFLKKEFPKAVILRMDMDTTGGKSGHEKQLKAFSRGEADILVGTQMIVKGHDFPNVTLVGALLADLSLNDQDYRSAERTFQLLLQASGRAGRGKLPGLAVIQTYEPEHYAIRAASAQDYQAFYREEIAFRRLLSYPPCGTMMAILVSSPHEGNLDTGMRYLREFIDRMDGEGQLKAIGPAPQAVGKIRDRYRRVIYLRHHSRKVLEEARRRIESYLEINRGFDSFNIQFDMNA